MYVCSQGGKRKDGELEIRAGKTFAAHVCSCFAVILYLRQLSLCFVLSESDSDPPSAMTEALDQLVLEWTFKQQQQIVGAGAQNTQLCCCAAPCYCKASLSP